MRDHNFFEGYARKHKMFPQRPVETKLGRVLLADSEEAILAHGRLFYRTGYAIERGGLDIGNFHEYDLNETGGSHSAKQQRLEEALMHATVTMAQLDDAGYFDDDRKADFSQ